jgi:predicted transcriptional regulator of viral defense system
VHPILRAAAERQLGLFTVADARRAGYEHVEIRRLCSSRRWVRLRRGVYTTSERLALAAEGGRRHQVECLAVLLQLDRRTAVLSHESAARLWGLPVRRGLTGQVRLTDPTLSRRGRGYDVTQAPLRLGDAVTSTPFRLTSVARTLLDCARRWDLDDAVVALDAALLAGRVTAQQLADGLMAQRAWPQARRAARAVSLANGRAESPLETRGRLRIVGAGLPEPELQVEIRTQGRLVGVVDAWFEEAAVAIEFDGRVKYTDPWRGRSPEQVLWEEKRREDELRALDIRVVRLADPDLADRWPASESRLRELLTSSGPTIRRFTATPRARARQQSA